jgi:hypothetical protein
MIGQQQESKYNLQPFYTYSKLGNVPVVPKEIAKYFVDCSYIFRKHLC